MEAQKVHHLFLPSRAGALRRGGMHLRTSLPPEEEACHASRQMLSHVRRRGRCLHGVRRPALQDVRWKDVQLPGPVSIRTRVRLRWRHIFHRSVERRPLLQVVLMDQICRHQDKGRQGEAGTVYASSDTEETCQVAVRDVASPQHQPGRSQHRRQN